MVQDTIENVRVFIRIRPQKEDEESQNPTSHLEVNKNVITLNKSGIDKTFKFCKIFYKKSTQLDIYRVIAAPIIERVFKGYNGTIFAYGQSGTGKTHTMIGDITDTNQKGIIPNTFSHIFEQISVADKDISHIVTVTYLEIYNEEIRDLLSECPTKKLTVHEKPGLGVFVKDLLGFTVDSFTSITALLAKGNKNRSTGSTNLNDHSSRSHAIFTIQIEAKNRATKKTVYGKINLVDLAGSERVAKSLATGDRLREAGKINLSLSVLGNVISALIDENSRHIPYRNSKLTRLLQDSLGGSSLTAMIAMLSPNNSDCEENLYTLMYADRVKHIQNHVRVNVEKQSLIDTFENQIARLKQELEMLTYQQQRVKKKRRRKTETRPSSVEQDAKVQAEKKNLETKINLIQRKILIGGENLLEKTQVQLNLLDIGAKEIHHLDSAHELLKEVLDDKEKEKSTMEKLYVDLQEEDRDLDKRIKGTEALIAKSLEVMAKKESEYQNEIGGLLYTNKVLAREMTLVDFVVKSVVPQDCFDKINSKLRWDNEIQEWQIEGVAYCGNNMQQTLTLEDVNERITSQEVYRRYRSRKKK